MKRLVWVLILGSLFATSSAFAAPAENNFPRFFTVGADGDTTKKNEFSIDETPWAFGQTDGVGSKRHAHVQTDWYFNSTLLGEADGTGPDGEARFWLTPANWNTIKKEGKWTVLGFFQVHNEDDSVFKTGNDSYSFTVTPEPASMALFAMGAGAMAFSRRRSKKK